MEIAVAVLAAIAATGFAVDLGLSYRSRPRPHAGVWAIAMGMYALATWSLVAGLAGGWTTASFKSFFFFGAIANIPMLAAGSVYLNASDAVARVFTTGVAVFVGIGAIVVVSAPLGAPVPAEGIPEGSELFDFGFSVWGATVPGPRLFAAIAGAVGSLMIIGFAARAVVRSWNGARRVAYGNILIVFGTLVPASAGSLAALGDAGALAFSLFVGAVLLWSGYRVASSARAVEARPPAD